MPEYRLDNRLSVDKFISLMNVYLELHGKVFYKVFRCTNLDIERKEKIGLEFIVKER